MSNVQTVEIVPDPIFVVGSFRVPASAIRAGAGQLRNLAARQHELPRPGPGVIGRRVRYPWDEWSDEQRRTFVEIAGETMLRYGLATEPELEVEREPTARRGA